MDLGTALFVSFLDKFLGDLWNRLNQAIKHYTQKPQRVEILPAQFLFYFFGLPLLFHEIVFPDILRGCSALHHFCSFV